MNNLTTDVRPYISTYATPSLIAYFTDSITAKQRVTVNLQECITVTRTKPGFNNKRNVNFKLSQFGTKVLYSIDFT